jgi:zinc protease
VTSSARPVSGSPRDYHFPSFTRHALRNGLKVVIAPVKKLPVVTVLAVVDAGAIADPRGKEGLAQLTAEALREGTSLHNGIEILEGFERLGSSFEAGSDWDSTVLSMTVLSNQLTKALPLFVEVLRFPSFPVNEIERLKAERLAERLQVLLEPRALADESLSRVVYEDGSRYSEPLAGNTTAISAITHADVVRFFNSHYTSGAVTMIITGDIDTTSTLEQVESVVGDWQGVQDFSGSTKVQESGKSRVVEITAKPDAAQAELRLGHIGIPRSHPDYFSVVVMNAVLGGLFSSRINLNLREKHGYTYGASSFYDWRRNPGPFVIATAVQSEITADAIRETLLEVDGMRNSVISSDELSLATSYLEGVFPIRYETTSAIASALANLVIFDLPENYYDEYRRNIHEVSPSDVLKAAQAHIHPEKLRIVVVGDPKLLTEPIEKLKLGSVSVRPPAEA